MLVALGRYHHRGLYAIERSSAAAMDRLAVAARQLPDADREVLSATCHPASGCYYTGRCYALYTAVAAQQPPASAVQDI